jgi:aryl-alcohol dehydrogenase-like predicted oxidoreductase
VCAHKGVTLAQAALGFSLASPKVDVTVIGASTPQKLRERAAVCALKLNEADYAEMIQAAGASFRFEWSSEWYENYNANMQGG